MIFSSLLLLYFAGTVIAMDGWSNHPLLHAQVMVGTHDLLCTSRSVAMFGAGADVRRSVPRTPFPYKDGGKGGGGRASQGDR